MRTYLKKVFLYLLGGTKNNNAGLLEYPDRTYDRTYMYRYADRGRGLQLQDACAAGARQFKLLRCCCPMPRFAGGLRAAEGWRALAALWAGYTS